MELGLISQIHKAPSCQAIIAVSGSLSTILGLIPQNDGSGVSKDCLILLSRLAKGDVDHRESVTEEDDELTRSTLPAKDVEDVLKKLLHPKEQPEEQFTALQVMLLFMEKGEFSCAQCLQKLTLL